MQGRIKHGVPWNRGNAGTQFLNNLFEDCLVLLLYNSHSYFPALFRDFCFLPFPCHHSQGPATVIFASCATSRPRRTESAMGFSFSSGITFGLFSLPSCRRLYSVKIWFFCICASLNHIWQGFTVLSGIESWSCKSTSLGKQVKFTFTSGFLT